MVLSPGQGRRAKKKTTLVAAAQLSSHEMEGGGCGCKNTKTARHVTGNGPLIEHICNKGS